MFKHRIFFSVVFCTILSEILLCSFSRPSMVVEDEHSEEAELSVAEDTKLLPSESVPAIDAVINLNKKIAMKEVWGYVMAEREYEFSGSMPVTDIGYFSADINTYGELSKAPSRPKIAKYKGRIHLVTACDSKSLTHFILDPTYPLKDKLVKSLVAASADYDGLQVDYELVPARDGKNFLNFLKDLKKTLPETKMLTVALPARTKTIADDVYDYASISEVVDRIIVMAYDEHWSTSAPGSIASINWCERIVNYCKTVIPSEKLVMGLPFYGRTWGNVSANKAYYFSGINRIMKENDNPEVKRDNSIPYFKYTTELTVTGYYEDYYSLVTRCSLYKDKDINMLAFWRIGQEDPSFWQYLTIDK